MTSMRETKQNCIVGNALIQRCASIILPKTDVD